MQDGFQSFQFFAHVYKSRPALPSQVVKTIFRDGAQGDQFLTVNLLSTFLKG